MLFESASMKVKVTAVVLSALTFVLNGLQFVHVLRLDEDTHTTRSLIRARTKGEAVICRKVICSVTSIIEHPQD